MFILPVHWHVNVSIFILNQVKPIYKGDLILNAYAVDGGNYNISIRANIIL